MWRCAIGGGDVTTNGCDITVDIIAERSKCQRFVVGCVDDFEIEVNWPTGSEDGCGLCSLEYSDAQRSIGYGYARIILSTGCYDAIWQETGFHGDHVSDHVTYLAVHRSAEYAQPRFGWRQVEWKRATQHRSYRYLRRVVAEDIVDIV